MKKLVIIVTGKLACLLLTLILSSLTINAYCQTSVNTTISGVVIDATTKEPMPSVAVSLENTTIGTITDLKGRYQIITSATSYTLRFDFLGYEDVEKVIVPGKKQIINVQMTPSSIMLNEVVVRPEKVAYRNKNNPSVELIEKVINKKDENRKESLEFYKYSKYDKVVFSVSNIGNKAKNIGLLKDFRFVFNNTDTSREDGTRNLPLFIQETQSDFFYRKTPRATKERIIGEKTINFDEYIDPRGVTAYIRYMYQNINIYDNEIFFLTNKFLSPVARTAPAFYKYFIQDTALMDGTSCIRVFFQPRNPADFLFHGFLYITNDSSSAIRKIDMSFNKGINIDWIKDVRVIQDFERVQGKSWLLTKDDILIEFGITEKLPGMQGERMVSYNNYSINEPFHDSVFSGQLVDRSPDMMRMNSAYWDSVRNPPLKNYEKNIYTLVDTIRTIPSFRRDMDLIMLLTTSFYTRKNFELGPVGSFYSYNTIEGSRIRLGGRTTPGLSRSFYLEGYFAYGFGDRQPKYNITASYALNHKSIYTFPVHALRLSYQYETSIPGQGLQFYAQDNIFLSAKRGIDDKIYYNRTVRAEYQNEYQNHFSFAIGYGYTRRTPGGSLSFLYADSTLHPHPGFINISEPYMRFRFAPNEEFYQGKLYRDPLPSRSPVIQVSYAFGSRSFGNDYNYQKLQFSVSRRFYLSIAGYTDVLLDAGKVFGTAPYPYLFIHNANQTFIFDKYSYNMMNFLEFVSDKYVSLNIDHSFNGFFFNKIPLLKKLRLREVATLKVLYGGLGNSNDPSVSGNMLHFPADANGVPLTYTLEKKPYIEASLGCSNIFRVLRVDIVKRFSYLDLPNAPSIGVRFKVMFDL